MNKIIIIGGPTGSGKTEIALELAKKFDGELINADSRQVYKYLNIGTNKGNIKNDKLEGIPIHLVDIINPDQRFNVYEFQQLAFQKIQEVLDKGKLPIVVGGTGLYIDSIIKKYDLHQNDNPELRAELEDLSTEQLKELAREKNLVGFLNLNNSDQNNPRRLVRLIEKVENKFKNHEQKASTIRPEFEYLFLYPEYNWEELKLKIENGVDEMFEEGIVEETKKVFAQGYKSDDPGLQVMGYYQIIQFLNGEFDLEKAKELIKLAHKQYAKRQRTWFEGEGRDYKLTKFKNKSDVITNVEAFI